MTEEILRRLLRETTLSGEALSRELGVTRAAIWKQIERLRHAGFQIEAQPSGGYRLLACPDSLMAPLIERGLNTAWAGCAITSLQSVDSTNRQARRMAADGAPEGAVVLADEQTQGRGRRGRGWLTPAGEGIALSILLRPKTPPARVALVSLSVALAAAEACEAVAQVPALLKWPNDVVLCGKKVAGILLEMDADEQQVHSLVAGIGFNVHQKTFPEEIAGTAISLDLASGKTIERAALVRAFLQVLERSESLRAAGTLLPAYRARSATLGRSVLVFGANERFDGVAEEITPSGALLVRTQDGELREVLAGDVSVRGLMGYV